MSDETPSDAAAREAAWWSARLKQVSVDQARLRKFWAWRQTPENLAAWNALHAERKAFDRFVVRPDSEGYSVVDIWTGEAAVIAMTPQTGISQPDAQHTARLLNRRAAGGDRSVPQ